MGMETDLGGIHATWEQNLTPAKYDIESTAINPEPKNGAKKC